MSSISRGQESPKKIPWLVFGVGAMLGAIAISLYALQFSPVSKAFSIVSIGVASAGAAFCVGGIIGFLFGIPRTLTDSAARQSISQQLDYEPNTNLEQISDWLTKILVGVGLTQIASVPTAVQSLSDELRPAFGDLPTSGAFAVTLLIYFFIVGFMVIYLWTRIEMPGALRTGELIARRIDDAMADIKQALEENARAEAHLHRLVEQAIAPGVPSPSEDELEMALTNAGQAQRDYALEYAMQYAQFGGGYPERAAWMARILLKPSIEVRRHEVHATLGMALMHMETPKFEEAEKELSTAIDLRARANEPFQTRLFEYYRALARIHLDKADTAEGRPETRKEAILSDLKLVASEPGLVERIQDESDYWGSDVREWIGRNPDVNLPDLAVTRATSEP